MRTPINEEAQNKGETLQCERVQCGKAHAPFLDQKPRKYVNTAGSDVQNRFKKLVKCDSDHDPRLHVRSNFLDGSSQGCQSSAEHESADVK